MSDLALKRKMRREKIKRRIHKKIQGTSECPRLVVFRSLKSIYAQIVDDSAHRTLATVSSQSKELKPETEKTKGKIDSAKIVGKAIGEAAKKLNISQVVFDRNGYLYHGRVKAVAEGAREAGLKF
jgi:large subunit ribosomal protein L18